MPNIIINNYCNLKCSYCFAKDVIEKQKCSMTTSNFEYVLNFHKNNKLKEIRLLGGEPTLHPDFLKFIAKIVNDPFFNHIHIFSNCVFNETILNDLILMSKLKHISILPNVNLNIPDNQYKIMLNNIEQLSKNKIVKELGLNIYDTNQNIEFIFELLKKYNFKSMRWSLAIPNTSVEKTFNYKEYVLSFIPLLKRLYKLAAEYNIELHRDCNSLPLCILDNELLQYMMFLSPRDLLKENCHPVIDIDMNLNVVRCFGLSENGRFNLKDYNSIQELSQAFDDLHKDLISKPLFENCKECIKYKKDNTSCSCLKYKMR